MVWFCLSGAIISANLHMAQLMPLPLTVSCFSKIQIGFTFLVPAHLGSPGKRAVKWVCVYIVMLQHCSCNAMIIWHYAKLYTHSNVAATNDEPIDGQQPNIVHNS